MKQSEIKELTTNELVERIEVESASLQKLRMVHAVSPLENPMQIRDARRNVARLKSEVTRRAINENKG
ncbi:50S ribosomal protein L29 [bacterium SCSIO 12643]|nr:50S ribosomal protein L29 [bacterium SCSIO 12643]